MTESRDGVDPPFSKRSIQLTIVTIALTVSLWQFVTLMRLRQQAGTGEPGHGFNEAQPWGELAGNGHPLIQIDINRADSRELALLPGVGPILARRIVENRKRVGPFESVEALARVHGIGRKTIEQIQVLGYAGGNTDQNRRDNRTSRWEGTSAK